MKISYSNYPILKSLYTGKLGTLPILQEDSEFIISLGGSKFLTDLFKSGVDNFKVETNIITKPFKQAVDKAYSKLSLLMADIMKNDLADFGFSGTYIIKDIVYMINYQTKQGSEDQDISLMIFSREGLPLAGYYVNEKLDIGGEGWISNNFEVPKDKDKIKKWFWDVIIQLSVMHMFKQYAQVETVLLPPNSKVKGINCKYVNDTQIPFTYLDSKWFTELVKSDGFSVSGHFRLQPVKKDGKWTKELIWINPFEKTGYTSKARKEQQT